MQDSDLQLLNCIPMPLFVLEPDCDGQLNYVVMNNAAVEFSRFERSDYVGRNAEQVYHAEYGKYAYQMQLEAYHTAQPTTYELSLPINGKLRHFRTHLVPVLNADGRVIRLIGASTDISAERELALVREESHNIEYELQEFVYLAAHDLRSPMKKVHVLADLLREDFEDLGDGKLEIINMLERVSVESMSMVQSVLRHAEITGLDESIEEISLPHTCNSIMMMLDPDNLHQCRVDDCTIYCDSVLIQTVLRNLIDNAVKHNAETSIALDVSSKNTASGFFSLTVADNGQGMISPNKLFESSKTGRSKSGFGLLAIRKLIKRRGGHIHAENPADGAGVSVTVILPGEVR